MLRSDQPHISKQLVWPLLVALAMGAGCLRPAIRRHPAPPVSGPASDTQWIKAPPVARELDMVSLPTYRIEPPDSLMIVAVRVVPKPPFKVQPQDILQVTATGTFVPGEIQGFYSVESNGTINLGASYGEVRVADLSLEEAREAVRSQLLKTLRAENVNVVVQLAQSLASQQVGGEHGVGPDGMIHLGVYGSVHVAGQTLAEAKTTIEEHLSRYLLDPVISVSISSFNSKFYYIVMEGGVAFSGVSDQIFRQPITGGETVLDAIAQIQGFTQFQTKNIWIARPAPDNIGADQILPVRWKEITSGASVATNYQLMPGDRVFIAEDKFWATQVFVDKIIRPFERIVAFTLLNSQTIQNLNRLPKGVNATSLL